MTGRTASARPDPRRVRTVRAAALIALVAMAALLAGCTLFPSGGRPNAPRAGMPSPMGHGLKEYRVAFHVHCHLSHDSTGTVEEIAEAARSLGIDTVILTDHYEPGNIARAPRGVTGGVLFIPGVEERGGGGSILSFPLKADYDKKLDPAATLAEFDRQGAMNVLGHVEEIEDWSLEPFQGFEVYNLHAEFKAASRWNVIGRLLVFPPDAFFESFIRPPSENLRTWDRELARGRRLTPLAGHDAHANVKILGATVGTYSEMLRLFTNRVLADAWTPAALASAIRAGRTFVVFDYLGGASGFSMTYGERGAPADRRAILGDDAVFAEDRTLEVRVPETASPFEVRVLRNGQIIGGSDAPRFWMTLPGEGIYRSEVYKGSRLWIVSGTIHVKRTASG